MYKKPLWIYLRLCVLQYSTRGEFFAAWPKATVRFESEREVTEIREERVSEEREKGGERERAEGEVRIATWD